MNSSDIVLPRQARLFLYAALTIVSPIIAYLSVIGTIGQNEVALYAGISGAIALLAGLNVAPKDNGDKGDPIT